MSGNAGSVSGPTAETTKFAVKVPWEVLTCHRASWAFHRTSWTSQPNRCLSSTWCCRATCWM